jgi:hypothetical protein
MTLAGDAGRSTLSAPTNSRRATTVHNGRRLWLFTRRWCVLSKSKKFDFFSDTGAIEYIFCHKIETTNLLIHKFLNKKDKKVNTIIYLSHFSNFGLNF